ncbi:ArsI/CadI family heavy metal resistance metalloenzyme [Planctomycetota bacterium]|nr:ArsI/CadI family heavy metal resistance metalloenzyme [Planctomycetota bacterium]
MKTRVHVAINVSNLEDSIKFYEAAFNHKASKLRPGYANFKLDQPGIHLALSVSDNVGRATSAEHFGVEFTTHAAFKAEAKRLKETGVDFREETETDCCYANSDKIWLSDPDGNAWEMFFTHGEAKTSDGKIEAGESCCVPSPSGGSCC